MLSGFWTCVGIAKELLCFELKSFEKCMVFRSSDVKLLSSLSPSFNHNVCHMSPSKMSVDSHNIAVYHSAFDLIMVLALEPPYTDLEPGSALLAMLAMLCSLWLDWDCVCWFSWSPCCKWYLQLPLKFLSDIFGRYSLDTCTLFPNAYKFLLCVSVL